MPIITISRQTGSGAAEIATRVAERLGLRYVDRQIIHEAARAVGGSWSDLVEGEREESSFVRRVLEAIGGMPPIPAVSSTRQRELAIADNVREIMKRKGLTEEGAQRNIDATWPSVIVSTPGSAVGIGPSPLPAMQLLPPELTYDDLIRLIFEDLVQQGNVLIVGRGGGVLLNRPDVLRILVVAPFEARVRRIQEREGVDEKKARRIVGAADRARVDFYKRHFKVRWPDFLLQDLVINTERIDGNLAVDLIVAAAQRQPGSGT